MFHFFLYCLYIYYYFHFVLLLLFCFIICIFWNFLFYLICIFFIICIFFLIFFYNFLCIFCVFFCFLNIISAHIFVFSFLLYYFCVYFHLCSSHWLATVATWCSGNCLHAYKERWPRIWLQHWLKIHFEFSVLCISFTSKIFLVFISYFFMLFFTLLLCVGLYRLRFLCASCLKALHRTLLQKIEHLRLQSKDLKILILYYYFLIT